MASTNHTSNYNLPQWVKTDAIKMEDFNDAFSKIDTQIKNANTAASNASTAAANAGNCSITTGSWTGNGSSTRNISLPWTPKCVIILGHHNSSGTVESLVTILTADADYYIEDGGRVSSSDLDACISGAAIQLRNKNWHNSNGLTVHYIAFK